LITLNSLPGILQLSKQQIVQFQNCIISNLHAKYVFLHKLISLLCCKTHNLAASNGLFAKTFTNSKLRTPLNPCSKFMSCLCLDIASLQIALFGCFAWLSRAAPPPFLLACNHNLILLIKLTGRMHMILEALDLVPVCKRQQVEQAVADAVEKGLDAMLLCWQQLDSKYSQHKHHQTWLHALKQCMTASPMHEHCNDCCLKTPAVILP